MTLVIGTRASALAQAQARLVADLLGRSEEVEVRVIRTHEADAPERPLRELGESVFVSRLEDALRRGEIDVAVHSLKDLPTGERPGLVIGAVPLREDPRDVLFARGRRGLGGLPRGGRVGTGSPRRAAFLKALRPDLQIDDIRGNVDTRMRKVLGGDYDGAVLALAGLRRMGVAVEEVEVLSLAEMLPAPGQGALAAQCRADDALTQRRLRAIDDPAVRAATEAERALLHALGASCDLPLGAYARADDGEIALEAALATEAGVRRARERGRDPLAVAERAAAALGALTRV